MGHTVRYPSLYASSLLYSVEDLRNERPDITSGEISSLLNIDIDWADYLMDLPNQFLQSFEYNVQIQTNEMATRLGISRDWVEYLYQKYIV